METSENEEIIEYSNFEDPRELQVYQQDKALVDIQIATAKRYPRNLERAINNSITLVTLDRDAAESCTFSLKKGGKLITGPSVHLARILVQNMGNMRAETRVVGFDSTHVTCEAFCFDLESNIAIRTQIKKSIIGNNGMYSEDMKVTTSMACSAIAFRNAVFAVIPVSIVKKVYNAAKKKITGDISTADALTARRTTLIEGIKRNYSDLALTDIEIARAVNKGAISHIGEEEILVLVGLEKSIQSGEISAEEVFRGDKKVKQLRVVSEDKSEERLIKLIEQSKTRKELSKFEKECLSPTSRIAYDNKFKELK